MPEVYVEIWEAPRSARIGAKNDKWFPGCADMAKEIPGGRWDKENKLWHYPLNLTTCRTLRSVYQDMLVIGPRLANWAREEIEKTKQLEDLGKKMDAELVRIPEVAPRMADAMANRTYQRVGARFIAQAREVLLADEPTLGKTIQYLGGVIEAGIEDGVHLIAAPKSSLETVWADEILKWTDFEPHWMPEGKAKREKALQDFVASDHPQKFLIVNPEMLQVKIEPYCKKCDQFFPKKTPSEDYPIDHWTDAHNTIPKIRKCDWPDLFEINWSSVCVDEAHKYLLGIRGPKNKTQTGEGFTRLRVDEGGVRLASTGTPMKGKAMSFWSTFHWLKPKQYPGKWEFAESFLEIHDNGFGKSIGDIRPEREQALLESLRPIMLRRTKREVQPDLPEDMYQHHWVSMTGQHLKQYNDLVRDGEAEIEGGTLSPTGVLAEFTRQKQFAFGSWQASTRGLEPQPGRSPKFDLLVSMLAKRGVSGDPDECFNLEGGFKYIIGSQFTKILDFLEHELNQIGIETIKITGAVTGSKRTAAQRAFQNKDHPTRVLLVNTIAGGAALTLDAWCDEMFILDETWVHDEQIQLEGRIRNRDVEKRVAVRTYHYIRTKGTIEEEIFESGLSQDEFQKKILDRSRGVKVKKRSNK